MPNPQRHLFYQKGSGKAEQKISKIFIVRLLDHSVTKHCMHLFLILSLFHVIWQFKYLMSEFYIREQKITSNQVEARLLNPISCEVHGHSNFLVTKEK
jgi:hypothetical protein